MDPEEYGIFPINIEDILDNTIDSDDDLYATINMEEFQESIRPVTSVNTETASSVEINAEVLNQILTETEMENLPPPEMPVSTGRFKPVTETEIENMFDARQSKSTKKNTAWALKIFQDWSMETFGQSTDFSTVSSTKLAEMLKKFYCEVRPKDGEVYHRNSLISIRAAINRYLTDLKRNIDVAKDKEFKICNGVLDGLLKQRVAQGFSKPTQHKEIIEKGDLEKISTYLKNAACSPIILRHAVWYFISIHFVTRGMEFHFQLKPDSFLFITDESGEYATLSHQTQQKNFQGGLESKENHSEKRMYASPELDCCPVKLLKLLIEKTDKQATKLFNQYSKQALSSPLNSDVWFTSKPLSKRTFSRFLHDICTAAGVDPKKYTPHCLRATSIQHLNDLGYEARHIMFMSNHRCESSLRSYNRNVSTSQKKSLSASLTSLTNPALGNTTNSVVPVPTVKNMPTPYLPTPNRQCPQNVICTSNSQLNNLTPGFFSNSSFSGCIFNIQHSGVNTSI